MPDSIRFTYSVHIFMRPFLWTPMNCLETVLQYLTSQAMVKIYKQSDNNASSPFYDTRSLPFCDYPIYGQSYLTGSLRAIIAAAPQLPWSRLQLTQKTKWQVYYTVDRKSPHKLAGFCDVKKTKTKETLVNYVRTFCTFNVKLQHII